MGMGSQFVVPAAVNLEPWDVSQPGKIQPLPMPQYQQEHRDPLYWAQRWGVCTKTIRKWFANEPDVLVIRVPGGKRKRLRIPDAAAERVYRRMMGGK